jgi:hypothetical protein
LVFCGGFFFLNYRLCLFGFLIFWVVFSWFLVTMEKHCLYQLNNVLGSQLNNEKLFLIIIWDLILAQHQYNNCTITPHMRVGPSIWDSSGIWFLYNTNTTTLQQLLTWGWAPVCVTHPHVSNCCTVVVLVL